MGIKKTSLCKLRAYGNGTAGEVKAFCQELESAETPWPLQLASSGAQGQTPFRSLQLVILEDPYVSCHSAPPMSPVPET